MMFRAIWATQIKHTSAIPKVVRGLSGFSIRPGQRRARLEAYNNSHGSDQECLLQYRLSAKNTNQAATEG